MSSPAIDPEPGTVVVTGDASSFAQHVAAGRHRLVADEPLSAGGGDLGPGPYDPLLAALGSCTSMTVGMYARRKMWPLSSVRVRLSHSRIHAADCDSCETKIGYLDRIDVEIELVGALDEEQRARLLEIAEMCPIHRTLTKEISIWTRLAAAGAGA